MKMDILELAYQIIDMKSEISDLKRELAHKNELLKIHQDSIEESAKHGNEMLGIMLGSIMDTDSIINVGHRAILKEKGE